MESETTVEEIVLAGEWAYVRGSYAFQVTPKVGGETAEEKGKFLYILTKSRDDSWKIARGIWNGNEAPSE